MHDTKGNSMKNTDAAKLATAGLLACLMGSTALAQDKLARVRKAICELSQGASLAQAP